MQPMVVRALLACAAAVLLFSGTVSADCPDRDVRCRIPNAESLVQESSSGCEGGGTVDVGFTGNVPSGSVSINGKCYKAYKDTDNTVFVPMGSISSGTCYDWLRATCRPCSSLVDACAAKVDGCKRCDKACKQNYTVVSGDTCWGIADDHGMTLKDLLQKNPGLNCEPLQSNTRICLDIGDGKCTSLCEGRFVD